MGAGSILLELGVIVFGLGVLGRLARMIGLTPIPLYLLAGLAFGKGGLMPVTTSQEFLATGADIGVILLLLLLGLEYSADELLQNLRSHAPAGLLNIVLNAAPGAAVAVILHWSPAAVLAMAGVTYAASSGIAAKLLRDLNRLGNRETPVILSLLVLEDLSMAFYLPILTVLTNGGGLGAALIAIAVAVAALAFVLLVALRFGGWINRLVFSVDDEVLLLRVFGLALLVAGLAEQAHVSSAVGAFLVGIALSGRVAEGARALLAPLRDFFAAVFFVFFGLDTNPVLVGALIAPAAGLAAITAGTKFLTGWWAAQRSGIGPLGRIRSGTAILARGEFNIVIAGLAAAAEPELGPLAAAYVLLLAVTGPVVTRIAEPLAQTVMDRRSARAAKASASVRR